MEGLLCAGHSASRRRRAFWGLERVVIILQESKIRGERQDLRKPTVWMESAVSAWNHRWEIGIIESQETRGLWVLTSWMGNLCYLPGDVKMWSRIIMWVSRKESTVFCLVLSKWCSLGGYRSIHQLQNSRLSWSGIAAGQESGIISKNLHFLLIRPSSRAPNNHIS